MSKLTTKQVWNIIYGRVDEVYDYAGRLMKKSACGNPKSRFYPTIDHVRPLSLGGADVLENLMIVHRDTNEEKSNDFPHWKANGNRYHAERVRGTRTNYIIYKD